MRVLFLLLALLMVIRAAQAQVVPSAPPTNKSAVDSAGPRRASLDSVKTRAEFDSAQSSAPQSKTDSVVRTHYWGRPQKAALYSAILPGAGQVYNKEAWKVPIVYAGLGTLAYFWITNAKTYNTYNNIILARADSGGSAPPKERYQNRYTTTQLIQIRQFYRRNRDLTIILSALTYLLQIADAHVFAHLKGFNTDDNLAIQPTALPLQGYGPGAWQPVAPGLSLTWRLR